ncbi:Na+/H+ antiporter NhaA [Longimicrobium sp.]|uniref:Na+/H+ antiporter NhaA n=1 Tax=Longimicrobium sp. TaxID=2029185 RepID=UPI002E30A50A|nr:Na+/H+ antiporter NhaA [Longimicrobium sp.]HEX6038842.1 Na+/H+ antiporter NhaA [Longimicrobium sp.]
MATHSQRVVPPTPLTPIQRVFSPFVRFARTESAGGIVLIAATLVAIAWANSPWSAGYEHLWETQVTLGAGRWALSYPLHYWINDGLMAVFFFLVGLEIKREFLVGELASLKRAALPIAAALGGMIVPAIIYAALNLGHAGERGWGIPMATDIAFALGVLALLGPRIPLSLKVFLAALAIVDDLGAVLVIAVFYTEAIHWGALALGFGLLAALVVANRMQARSPLTYLLVGIVVWVAFLKSGVHATVAGVLLAMTIPARTRIDTAEFLDRGRRILDYFDVVGEEGRDVLTNRRQQAAIQEMENACEAAQAPLQRIEHELHHWVAFLIIPIFALANAGVHLGGNLGTAFGDRVTLGIILGLVIGKPIGISLFAWLAVRTNLAALPYTVTWRAIRGVSLLGGIGFTMSLFIAGLAFPGAPQLNEDAKIGIFVASLVAGITGFLVLRGFRPNPVAVAADDGEG